MKLSIRLGAIIAAVMLVSIYMVSCNTGPGKVALDVAAKPFEKLSEYHLFTGVMNELKPNEGVVPYDLITPLFTDYAHKARFIYMPQGKTVPYDTTQVLQFPIGACLIKNFYYPDDFREKNGKRRIIETRLLVHRPGGWDALDYVWNDEQTEALLENAGDIKKVSWVHYDGTKREADYLIPNKNQCKGCHWNNSANGITPIGPKVRNLNRNNVYEGKEENQLKHLATAGILLGMPGDQPKLADWTDSVHYTLDQRARAYMDVNCGHCHNPKGPAYTSGLHLNLENANMENLGFCKAPVAAGKATGNLLYDIVPGHPEQSILIHRVQSTEPDVKMPELGRSLTHTEGLALLTQWIAEMKPSDCKVK